nr:hypothetical protein [Pilimelia anulata]
METSARPTPPEPATGRPSGPPAAPRLLSRPGAAKNSAPAVADTASTAPMPAPTTAYRRRSRCRFGAGAAGSGAGSPRPPVVGSTHGPFVHWPGAAAYGSAGPYGSLGGSSPSSAAYGSAGWPNPSSANPSSAGSGRSSSAGSGYGSASAAATAAIRQASGGTASARGEMPSPYPVSVRPPKSSTRPPRRAASASAADSSPGSSAAPAPAGTAAGPSAHTGTGAVRPDASRSSMAGSRVRSSSAYVCRRSACRSKPCTPKKPFCRRLSVQPSSLGVISQVTLDCAASSFHASTSRRGATNCRTSTAIGPAKPARPCGVKVQLPPGVGAASVAMNQALRTDGSVSARQTRSGGCRSAVSMTISAIRTA